MNDSGSPAGKPGEETTRAREVVGPEPGSQATGLPAERADEPSRVGAAQKHLKLPWYRQPAALIPLVPATMGLLLSMFNTARAISQEAEIRNVGTRQELRRVVDGLDALRRDEDALHAGGPTFDAATGLRLGAIANQRASYLDDARGHVRRLGGDLTPSSYLVLGGASMAAGRAEDGLAYFADGLSRATTAIDRLTLHRAIGLARFAPGRLFDAGVGRQHFRAAASVFTSNHPDEVWQRANVLHSWLMVEAENGSREEAQKLYDEWESALAGAPTLSRDAQREIEYLRRIARERLGQR